MVFFAILALFKVLDILRVNYRYPFVSPFPSPLPPLPRPVMLKAQILQPMI